MLCASLNGARQSPAKRAGRLETLLGHRRELGAEQENGRTLEPVAHGLRPVHRHKMGGAQTVKCLHHRLDVDALEELDACLCQGDLLSWRSWRPARWGAVGLHDRCRPEAASYRPAWLYGVNTTDSFHHPLSGGGGDPIALDNAGLASRAAVPKARPVASRTTT